MGAPALFGAGDDIEYLKTVFLPTRTGYSLRGAPVVHVSDSDDDDDDVVVADPVEDEGASGLREATPDEGRHADPDDEDDNSILAAVGKSLKNSKKPGNITAITASEYDILKNLFDNHKTDVVVKNESGQYISIDKDKFVQKYNEIADDADKLKTDKEAVKVYGFFARLFTKKRKGDSSRRGVTPDGDPQGTYDEALESRVYNKFVEYFSKTQVPALAELVNQDEWDVLHDSIRRLMVIRYDPKDKQNKYTWNNDVFKAVFKYDEADESKRERLDKIRNNYMSKIRNCRKNIRDGKKGGAAHEARPSGFQFDPEYAQIMDYDPVYAAQQAAMNSELHPDEEDHQTPPQPKKGQRSLDDELHDLIPDIMARMKEKDVDVSIEELRKATEDVVTFLKRVGEIKVNEEDPPRIVYKPDIFIPEGSKDPNDYRTAYERTVEFLGLKWRLASGNEIEKNEDGRKRYTIRGRGFLFRMTPDILDKSKYDWAKNEFKSLSDVKNEAQPIFSKYLNALITLKGEKEKVVIGAPPPGKKSRRTARDFPDTVKQLMAILAFLHYDTAYTITPITPSDRDEFGMLIYAVHTQMLIKRGIPPDIRDAADSALDAMDAYTNKKAPYDGDDESAYNAVFFDASIDTLVEYKPKSSPKQKEYVEIDNGGDFQEEGDEDETGVTVNVGDGRAPRKFPEFIMDGDEPLLKDAVVDPEKDHVIQISEEGEVDTAEDVPENVREILRVVDNDTVSLFVRLPNPAYWAGFHERTHTVESMEHWYGTTLTGIQAIPDSPGEFYWYLELDRPWTYYDKNDVLVQVLHICIDIRKEIAKKRSEYEATLETRIEEAQDGDAVVGNLTSKECKDAYYDWVHHVLNSPKVCFAKYTTLDGEVAPDWHNSGVKDVPEPVRTYMLDDTFTYAFEKSPEEDEDDIPTSMSENHKKLLERLFTAKSDLISVVLKNAIPKYIENRQRGLRSIFGLQKPTEYAGDPDRRYKHAMTPENFGLIGMPMVQDVLCREVWAVDTGNLPDFVVDAFQVVQDDQAYMDRQEVYRKLADREAEEEKARAAKAAKDAKSRAGTQAKNARIKTRPLRKAATGEIPPEREIKVRGSRDSGLILTRTFETWRKLHDIWKTKISIEGRLKINKDEIEALKSSAQRTDDKSSLEEQIRDKLREHMKMFKELAEVLYPEIVDKSRQLATEPSTKEELDRQKNNYASLQHEFLHLQNAYSYAQLKRQMEESVMYIDKIIVRHLENEEDDEDEDDGTESEDEDDDEDETIYEGLEADAIKKMKLNLAADKKLERAIIMKEDEHHLKDLRQRTSEIRNARRLAEAAAQQNERGIALYERQETAPEDECGAFEALMDELTGSSKKARLTPTQTYLNALKWLADDSGIDAFLPQDDPILPYSPSDISKVKKDVGQSSDAKSGPYQMWTKTELDVMITTSVVEGQHATIKTLTTDVAYEAFKKTFDDELDDPCTVVHHKRMVQYLIDNLYQISDPDMDAVAWNKKCLFRTLIGRFKKEFRSPGLSKKGEPRTVLDQRQSAAVNNLLTQAQAGLYVAQRFESGLHALARLLCDISAIKVVASDLDSWNIYDDGKDVGAPVKLTTGYDVIQQRSTFTEFPLPIAIVKMLKERIPEVEGLLKQVWEDQDLNLNRGTRADLTTKRASAANFRLVDKLKVMPITDAYKESMKHILWNQQNGEAEDDEMME